MKTLIRQARERVGLTQDQLASRVGVSQQAVQSWEAGKSEPAKRKWPALVKALETTPEYFGQAVASIYGRIPEPSSSTEYVDIAPHTAEEFTAFITALPDGIKRMVLRTFVSSRIDMDAVANAVLADPDEGDKLNDARQQLGRNVMNAFTEGILEFIQDVTAMGGDDAKAAVDAIEKWRWRIIARVAPASIVLPNGQKLEPRDEPRTENEARFYKDLEQKAAKRDGKDDPSSTT